jgi:hypothetical protein
VRYLECRSLLDLFVGVATGFKECMAFNKKVFFIFGEKLHGNDQPVGS